MLAGGKAFSEVPGQRGYVYGGDYGLGGRTEESTMIQDVQNGPDGPVTSSCVNVGRLQTWSPKVFMIVAWRIS